MPFPSAFTTGVVRRDPNTQTIEVTAIYWGPTQTFEGDVNVVGINWGTGPEATSGGTIAVTPTPSVVLARKQRQSFNLDVSKLAYFEIRIAGERPNEAAWAQYDFNVFALDKSGHIVSGNTFQLQELTFIDPGDLLSI